MAKYSKGAGRKVEKAMHEKKEGQAIAIGLAEARKKGSKVPKKKIAK